MPSHPPPGDEGEEAAAQHRLVVEVVMGAAGVAVRVNGAKVSIANLKAKPLVGLHEKVHWSVLCLKYL